jgi:hypothetical protein
MVKLNFLLPILLAFFISTKVSAQNIEKESWTTSVYFYPSLVSQKSDWEFSHPIYNGMGGVQYETITGTFEQSFALNGGLEISKGYFGFQGNLEIMPQKLTKSEPIEKKELNLFMGGVSILFYPMKYHDRSIKPYLSLGGDLLKASGDIDNTGFVIFYAAGVKIPISDKFGVKSGAKGMVVKYTQLKVAENISKDIRIYPFEFFAGIFYQL